MASIADRISELEAELAQLKVAQGEVGGEKKASKRANLDRLQEGKAHTLEAKGKIGGEFTISLIVHLCLTKASELTNCPLGLMILLSFRSRSLISFRQIMHRTQRGY